ncbi:hypothetical protein HK097_003958 [Rhizophlyctis rosea]|uniref:RING-type domain-containing protein n=1 Tax=Rhizophlyctis rosea TaxID=64517 RepID=A0AAD5WWY4_9FUNG|nr:hypothetical protein HK097_003958 [Rhizophlyctis rosea]
MASKENSQPIRPTASPTRALVGKKRNPYFHRSTTPIRVPPFKIFPSHTPRRSPTPTDEVSDTDSVPSRSVRSRSDSDSVRSRSVRSRSDSDSVRSRSDSDSVRSRSVSRSGSRSDSPSDSVRSATPTDDHPYVPKIGDEDYHAPKKYPLKCMLNDAAGPPPNVSLSRHVTDITQRLAEMSGDGYGPENPYFARLQAAKVTIQKAADEQTYRNILREKGKKAAEKYKNDLTKAAEKAKKQAEKEAEKERKKQEAIFRRWGGPVDVGELANEVSIGRKTRVDALDTIKTELGKPNISSKYTKSLLAAKQKIEKEMEEDRSLLRPFQSMIIDDPDTRNVQQSMAIDESTNDPSFTISLPPSSPVSEMDIEPVRSDDPSLPVLAEFCRSADRLLGDNNSNDSDLATVISLFSKVTVADEGVSRCAQIIMDTVRAKCTTIDDLGTVHHDEEHGRNLGADEVRSLMDTCHRVFPDETCGICLGCFVTSDKPAIVTSCGHYYCRDCIETFYQSLNTPKSCPQCPLPPTAVVDGKGTISLNWLPQPKSEAAKKLQSIVFDVIESYDVEHPRTKARVPIPKTFAELLLFVLSTRPEELKSSAQLAVLSGPLTDARINQLAMLVNHTAFCTRVMLYQAGCMNDRGVPVPEAIGTFCGDQRKHTTRYYTPIYTLTRLLGSGCLVAPITPTMYRNFNQDDQKLMLHNADVVEVILRDLGNQSIHLLYAQFDEDMERFLKALTTEDKGAYTKAFASIRNSLKRLQLDEAGPQRKKRAAQGPAAGDGQAKKPKRGARRAYVSPEVIVDSA